jgi:hypothetical protein
MNAKWWHLVIILLIGYFVGVIFPQPAQMVGL